MDELRKLLRDVYDKWGLETVKAIIAKLDSYPIQWRGTLRRSISYTQSGDDEIIPQAYGFNALKYKTNELYVSAGNQYRKYKV